MQGVRGATTQGRLVSRYVVWEGGPGGAPEGQLSRTVTEGTLNGVPGEKGPVSAAVPPTSPGAGRLRG